MDTVGSVDGKQDLDQRFSGRAVNGLQECQGSLGEGHLLEGSLGGVNPHISSIVCPGNCQKTNGVP